MHYHHPLCAWVGTYITAVPLLGGYLASILSEKLLYVEAETTASGIINVLSAVAGLVERWRRGVYREVVLVEAKVTIKLKVRGAIPAPGGRVRVELVACNSVPASNTKGGVVDLEVWFTIPMTCSEL